MDESLRRIRTDLSGDLPKRILIDASHALDTRRNTGVQRVVSNICRFLPLTNGVPPAVVVKLFHGRFVAVSNNSQIPLKSFVELCDGILASLPRAYVLVAELLCRMLPFRGLKTWLLPNSRHLGIFHLPLRLIHRASSAWRRGPDIQFAAGDLLLLPDAYWVRTDIWESVRRARQQGAFVVSIVYDLIPLTHPQFGSVASQEIFASYVEQLAKNSDMMLAISQTVCDELTTVLPIICPNVEYCRDARSFRLGAQFIHHSGTIRPLVQRIFSDSEAQQPYLMVATFDPRKNHAYLLDAFEQLWREDATRKLCLVGAICSGSESIIQQITQHPRFNHQLFVLHDATDVELDYCYRNARAVIMPSIVEGFGLPIVEGQWHNRHVFASDTPIHREVGGEGCSYFDINSPESLCQLIRGWERTKASSGDVAAGNSQLLNWRQSTEQLAHQCLASYADQSRARNATNFGRAA